MRPVRRGLCEGSAECSCLPPTVQHQLPAHVSVCRRGSTQTHSCVSCHTHPHTSSGGLCAAQATKWPAHLGGVCVHPGTNFLHQGVPAPAIAAPPSAHGPPPEHVPVGADVGHRGWWGRPPGQGQNDLGGKGGVQRPGSWAHNNSNSNSNNNAQQHSRRQPWSA